MTISRRSLASLFLRINLDAPLRPNEKHQTIGSHVYLPNEFCNLMIKERKEWVNHFTGQPYENRKLVIFVDDEKFDIEYEAGSEDRRYINIETGDDDLNDLSIDRVGLAMIGLSEGPKSFLEAHAFNLPSGADESLLDQDRPWEQDIPLTPIPLSWRKHLHLPPSHPRREVLYAANPHARRNYLPIERFHYSVFEHKFSEVMRILMHLGANKIDVQHEKGLGKEVGGKVDAKIPYVDTEAEFEVDASSESEALYYAELDGHDDPSLPDDLSWYHSEPTWKRIAEGRREFGLSEFSLTLRYDDDFGIDADLAAEISSFGFSTEFSFEEHQETVWEVECEFGP